MAGFQDALDRIMKSEVSPGSNCLDMTMANRKARTARCLTAAALVVFGPGSLAPAVAQERQPAAIHECSVDLARAADMKDIVSNALLRGPHRRAEPEVRAFLAGAEGRYATGPEVLRAAAAHFKINEAVMAAEVERVKHVNCPNDPVAEGAPAATGGGEQPD